MHAPWAITLGKELKKWVRDWSLEDLEKFEQRNDVSCMYICVCIWNMDGSGKSKKWKNGEKRKEKRRINLYHGGERKSVEEKIKRTD